MADYNGSQDSVTAERIRDELDKRGWSQRQLADQAKLGEATVFRFLKGRFTRRTLRKIEQALEIGSRDDAAGSFEVAELNLGGYARDIYRYFEGEYLFVRPAFSNAGKYCTYKMTIAWSADPRGLAFTDHNPGYEQRGVLAIPRGTQFIHFLTLDTGSARLMSAYHMPPTHNTMCGLTLTFANPSGRTLFPAAAPFIMYRLDDRLRELLERTTMIDKSDQDAERFNQDFARLDTEPIMLEA